MLHGQSAWIEYSLNSIRVQTRAIFRLFLITILFEIKPEETALLQSQNKEQCFLINNGRWKTKRSSKGDQIGPKILRFGLWTLNCYGCWTSRWVIPAISSQPFRAGDLGLKTWIAYYLERNPRLWVVYVLNCRVPYLSKGVIHRTSADWGPCKKSQYTWASNGIILSL